MSAKRRQGSLTGSRERLPGQDSSQSVAISGERLQREEGLSQEHSIATRIEHKKSPAG